MKPRNDKEVTPELILKFIDAVRNPTEEKTKEYIDTDEPKSLEQGSFQQTIELKPNIIREDDEL